MKNLLKCNPLQHPCNKHHLCEVLDTEEWTFPAGSLGFYCVASVRSYRLHMDFCDVFMGRCSSSIIFCSSGGSALKSANDALVLPGLAWIGLKSLNRTHALQEVCNVQRERARAISLSGDETVSHGKYV